MGKILRLLVVLILVVGGAFYFRYGTLSPCGALRVTEREALAKSPSGLERVLGAAMSDALLDPMLVAKFGGPLTPSRCLRALIDPVGTSAQK